MEHGSDDVGQIGSKVATTHIANDCGYADNNVVELSKISGGRMSALCSGVDVATTAVAHLLCRWQGTLHTVLGPGPGHHIESTLHCIALRTLNKTTK